MRTGRAGTVALGGPQHSQVQVILVDVQLGQRVVDELEEALDKLARLQAFGSGRLLKAFKLGIKQDSAARGGRDSREGRSYLLQ
jgi:hypothetical protein